MLSVCVLSEDEDHPKWLWEKSGNFSVKSMYEHLGRNEITETNKRIWKAKIPLKIKIFMWLVEKNAILTKDNLVRKNWQGDKKCAFCLEEENLNHLFFECYLARYVWSLVAWTIGANCIPMSVTQFWTWIQTYMPHGKNIHMAGLAAIIWAMWKARNNVCFEGKLIRVPTEIVFSACSFLSYWTGLQKGEDKEAMEKGAEMLKAAALQFHPQEAGRDDTGMVLLQ